MPPPSRLRRQLLALPFATALPSARGAGTPLVLRLPDPNAYSAHGHFFIDALKLALSKTADGEPPPTLVHAAPDLLQQIVLEMLAQTPERTAGR